MSIGLKIPEEMIPEEYKRYLKTIDIEYEKKVLKEYEDKKITFEELEKKLTK